MVQFFFKDIHIIFIMLSQGSILMNVEKEFKKNTTTAWDMGIKLPKIMMVGRVTMDMGLVSLVIDIFLKFFFHMH